MKVDTMNYKELVATLMQYPQSKRYLIVLDDVWSIRFWQEISIALPEGMCGSRIMVTTQREHVAPVQSRFVSYIHRIQPLREGDAWKLSCKRAFPNDLGRCPSHLDLLARKLVEKCEGLPLAIVTLGGLMSKKKSLAEWKKVQLELGAKQQLMLHLKDYEIDRKRLIRLWMAEGFLELVKDVPPETVAKSYLMNLINRSLLQVTRGNHFGRSKTFKMHDLVRKFALSKSKEEKLLVVSDQKNGEVERGIRRYSIEVKGKEMTPRKGSS
ncbi:hypothetical protein PTKIN_Ptkin11bG0067600 [Pterospermum kingtungense]